MDLFLRGTNFALGYLVYRFFYRVYDFLRHWYVKSIRIYANAVLNRLQRLDYYFAWRITLKHLFEPLYKDYSLIGYVLGFIFRTLRLLLASAVYVCIFGLVLAAYLLWLLLPPYLVFRAISG